MKKLTMFIALLAGAMTAQAKLGETKEQILRRFGGWEAVTEQGAFYLVFEHKNVAFIAFDADDRSVFELYMLLTKYTYQDADEIVRTVIGRKYTWEKVATERWQTKDGRYELATLTPSTKSGYQWGIALGVSGAMDTVFEMNPVDHAQPRAQQEAATTQPKKDCMVVATEMYARVKDAYWRAIVGVHWKGVNDGHAMAVWKISKDGHVFAYVDAEHGSLELKTSSEKIEDIANAFAVQAKQMAVSNWQFIENPKDELTLPTMVEIKP